MNPYKVKISKFLSFVLRHAPEKFELKADRNGRVPLNEVLDILHKRFKGFKKEDLFDLIKNDPKGRFEIEEDKIKAAYGHSIEALPKEKAAQPPGILYHGTSEKSAREILCHGLKPMGRQFVHMSQNKEQAAGVGLRHAKAPVILKIAAKEASAHGIEFFRAKNVFLARYIPKDFIEKL